MSDLVKRLRIKAGMIEMGEMIAWGSDSALMREAADALEMAAPAAQGEPVAFASFADMELCMHRPAGGEWTPVYAAPHPAEQQPAPDVAELQAELERERKRRFDGNEQASREHREDMKALVDALEAMLAVRVIEADANYGLACAKAEQALAAHRKNGGGQ